MELERLHGFLRGPAEEALAQRVLVSLDRAYRRVGALFDDAGGSAVANLLRDLGDGIDFDVAFRHRLNRSPREFASGYTF